MFQRIGRTSDKRKEATTRVQMIASMMPLIAFLNILFPRGHG